MLRNLITKFKARIFRIPLLKEFVLSFRLKIKKAKIGQDENRHLRVAILRYYVEKLKAKMMAIDFKQGILIYQNKEYVLSDGIFLNAQGTNRYFKGTGEYPGNEGARIYDFLKSRNIVINNMIDLGANFGEISLYFCHQNPNMKILAVEPSSENYEILKSNCEFQFFSTKNITLLKEAVADENKTALITKGKGSENNIISDKGETEPVQATTLLSIMDRFGFNNVDFLKIDIEGAEPLLYNSLKRSIGRIKSILLEISGQTEDYLPLLRLLWDSGMKCYLRDDNFTEVDSLPNLIKLLDNRSHALDLFFIKKL